MKGALRSASVRWPPRYETLADAFVDVRTNEKTGRKAKHFQCAKCHGIFPQKDIEINHKVPVVPVKGFDSWDGVIERLFCEKDGLEAMCKPCHKECTKSENEARKLNEKQL